MGFEELVEQVRGFTREPWVERGACRGVDPALFFPGVGVTADAVRAVCAGCPVTAECLDYALRNGEHYGIWGGTSERERRRMRREQGLTGRAAAPVDWDQVATVARAAIERGESGAAAIMAVFDVPRTVADNRLSMARRHGYDIPYQQERVA